MVWALVYLLLIFGAFAVFGLCALRLWRQVRATRTAALELRTRVTDLAEQASELAARLDSTEVAARLADRTG